MKTLVITSLLATLLAASVLVLAQYVGPDSSPKTVKELHGMLLCKDCFVTLKGHITRRVSHDLYEFSDGTGLIYLDLDHKDWHWPTESPVDQTTALEIYGKYVSKAFGYDKLKVIGLRLAK